MNRLSYPCDVMNITQNHTEGNHKGHLPDDLPFDEAGEGTGRNWFFCPCDEMRVVKLYGIGSGGVNTVWLESTAPVDMPCGRDYITVMVEHPEDDDLAKLSVGQIFTRGQNMFREGKDGATGNHFHISVARGHLKGTGWKNNGSAWALTATGAPLKADEAFYIDNTRIRNAAGYKFKIKSEEANMKKIDNTPDKYAEKAVQWAKENGILKGDTVGDLKLHTPITRQDMVVMLYRALRVNA
ncbi:MAG: S-layer homology domain-containing protein [Clostridia bacterium]|nr:S-layer homology domain-containing protein [Clostridia bacterium]